MMCALLMLVAAQESIQERDGLGNTLGKLMRGEPVTVVYFGGSITAGAGASKPEFSYRALLTKHLRETFPNAQVREVNAAIGGTGSWLGAFRVHADVLTQRPDLVVVEFAVNDGSSPEPQVLAALEGIVRRVRWNPKAELLFVYTLHKGMLDAYGKGETPDRVRWHERVAEHYGIPSVNVGAHAAGRILARDLTMEEFARDGVHPTDRGYALYADALKAFFGRLKPAEPKARPQPKPLTERPMEKGQLVAPERARADGPWKVGAKSPVDRFLYVVESDAPGATLTLRFRGDAAGFYDALGPDCGDLEVSVDGGEWKSRPNHDVFAKNGVRAHARVLAENLDPAALHEVRVRIAERTPEGSRGRFFRPGFFLVHGTLADDPQANLGPLERIDAVYATMVPVEYAPPPERWGRLPRTRERLTNGPSLKIVMLGDSIVNDTSSSKYELLLGRRHPKCRIEKITSVRGSTGCWWYKEENRVKEYVVDHAPDLLMIGGISQRDDVDSIREVVRQVRAALEPDPEILLMTGAFGTRQDPASNPAWTFEVDPAGSGYRSRLLRLAGEEGCAFLDLTGPWGRYVKDQPQHVGWFMRDPVHANERGFQILGRIVERYLTVD